MSIYPKNMLFTSESVTEGHPDKFCDQVSDAVLDECLRHDPMSRVACNTYVTMGLLLVGGEITTEALFDISKVVRDIGNEIGYTSPKYGFDVNTAAVIQAIHRQSPDIDLGVSKGADRSAQAIKGSCSDMPAVKRKSLCHCRSCWLTGLRSSLPPCARRRCCLIWGRMERPRLRWSIATVRL